MMRERPNRGARLVRRMNRAREAVMWLGAAWVLFVVILGVTWLVADPGTAAEASARGIEERALAIEQLSDGGHPLGQDFNPDRWTMGITRGSTLLNTVFLVLVVSSAVLLVWLWTAVFACARHHGGLAYGLGHLIVVVLGTPVLLVGPAWVPMLVEDDIERGRAARVRRLPNPTGLDVLAVGVVALLALAAYLW